MPAELSQVPESVQFLLQPLSAETPAGEDLLFSHDFDAIQDARRFDDPSLDQGEWVTDIKEADWDTVIERSETLLATRSKDLRLAVWLTEAWAIKRGLSGLAQGYALLNGLCTDFWDTFHPLAEDDDQGYRLGNVNWLTGRTAELLRAVPLTGGVAGMTQAYGALDWEVGTHLLHAVKRDPDNADDILRGKVTLDVFDVARRATPASFYIDLLHALTSFEQAYRALEQTLDARAGDDAPSFRQVKDAYGVVRNLAERFAADAGVDVAAIASGKLRADGAPVNGEKNGVRDDRVGMAQHRIEPQFGGSGMAADSNRGGMMGGGNEMGAGGSVGARGAIASRPQAIAVLQEVAAFFRRTEPHSPAAYMADKAAAWADMPLHEWLRVVVKDGTSLEQLHDMLGVKPEE